MVLAVYGKQRWLKMDDQAILKAVAIICLTALMITNFLTMKIDSTLTASIAAIIAGLAGYSFGRTKKG
jgi:4-amino-4-deoxy-L-arabinose transferase-like glycosyltransferase